MTGGSSTACVRGLRGGMFLPVTGPGSRSIPVSAVGVGRHVRPDDGQGSSGPGRGGDVDWLVSVDSTIVRAHQHAAAGKRGDGKRTNRKITPLDDPEVD